ncbi:hypothetical protein KI688_004534 [Linnemannia hyalina]|uniref:RNase H type-1 domain-containing protein n=1 Tax=Linnemannia hyalina TaxID=64524 RepID=A0A9P8BPI6_9FUNG|nr:hypothetical protein KI688_004534 [Linnemannia hyalina]
MQGELGSFKAGVMRSAGRSLERDEREMVPHRRTECQSNGVGRLPFHPLCERSLVPPTRRYATDLTDSRPGPPVQVGARRFRSTYAGIWAVLWQVVESRPGGVEVVWIKGHSNIHGNELADQAAKVAAQSGSVPWMVDLTQQTDITTFAHCYGGIVEIDLRQLLKQQSTIRHHQAWTSQRRVKRAIPDIDDVEWNSTLAYVHDRHAVFTFYSNSKDSHQRTHHIKKLHGMLPTLNSMQARKPNLYPTCVCQRCELEKEDNDHVWKCPSAAETTTEIWKEAMGKINEWGVQATNSYNAARKREYKRAVDSGRQVPRPDPYTGGPLRMRIMCEDFPPSVELEPCTAVVQLPIETRNRCGMCRISSAASPP